jgi:hypothetical protein
MAGATAGAGLTSLLFAVISRCIASHRVGILVHGCHLDADAWDTITWGSPPLHLGRLPTAALLAWQERSSLKRICLGTGASTTPGGETEADVALEMLLSRCSQLKEFDAFADVPLDQLAELLQRTARADTTSTCTSLEVREALKQFEKASCTRAYLVSSPTHLPRCISCACSELERQPGIFSGSILATPSRTNYAGFNAVDVVVVEPPHRGDRDRSLDHLPFHEMVRRCYSITANQKHSFLERFEALLQEFDV